MERMRLAVTTAVGYALALCAFVALRCDSLAHHAGRVAQQAGWVGKDAVR